MVERMRIAAGWIVSVLLENVLNRKFDGCQKIGWCFARVLTKSFNLLLAHKNARI